VKGTCLECGKEGEVVRHHSSYFPEQLRQVCRNCHGKIHRNSSSLNEEYREFSGLKGKTVIQLELSHKADCIAAFVKARNGFNTKSEAISFIVEAFDEHKRERLK